MSARSRAKHEQNLFALRPTPGRHRNVRYILKNIVKDRAFGYQKCIKLCVCDVPAKVKHLARAGSPALDRYQVIFMYVQCLTL